MSTSHVLLVANRTATDPPLIEAAQARVGRGAVAFHLVVPATPSGLHRLVDPEVAGLEAAQQRLELALATLREATGGTVTGHVGDANPLAAIEDALHLGRFDEIILSTLPWRLSRWMRVDLPSKVRALGVPLTHVTSTAARQSEGFSARTRKGAIQASANQVATAAQSHRALEG
jgi:hypothetical protein